MQATSFSEVNQGPANRPGSGKQLDTCCEQPIYKDQSSICAGKSTAATLKQHVICVGVAVSRRLVSARRAIGDQKFPGTAGPYLSWRDETEADPDALMPLATFTPVSVGPLACNRFQTEPCQLTKGT
jgi:hypothetical protein